MHSSSPVLFYSFPHSSALVVVQLRKRRLRMPNFAAVFVEFGLAVLVFVKVMTFAWVVEHTPDNSLYSDVKLHLTLHTCAHKRRSLNPYTGSKYVFCVSRMPFKVVETPPYFELKSSEAAKFGPVSAACKSFNRGWQFWEKATLYTRWDLLSLDGRKSAPSYEADLSKLCDFCGS